MGKNDKRRIALAFWTILYWMGRGAAWAACWIARAFSWIDAAASNAADAVRLTRLAPAESPPAAQEDAP
jgi:hypothetical protein